MIKVLFDTSVLVASILVNHEQHSACISWLTRVKRGEIQGYIGTHTLAELYAILSAFPAKPRLSPQLVQQLIKENLDSFEIISLTSDDYKAVINLMVTLNLRGGAIYDALIAYGSLKAEVDHLLTLNFKHFIRFGGRIEKISMEPR
ncbi:MAG: type II toxin-antitoxin system VapC family toxin [Microcystis panniformis]